MEAVRCFTRVIGTAAATAALALVTASSLHAQVGTPWVAPARRAARANPVASNPASIEQGRQVYRRECVKCHGPTGNNDGTDTKGADMSRAKKLSDASLWEESDGALFWKISEGRDPMPSQQDVLTENERWAVVNYIRTFAPRPAGH